MTRHSDLVRREKVDALWDELHRLHAAHGYPRYAAIERRTGIPKSTLHDWFTQRTVPTWDRLAPLLAFFGEDQRAWRPLWQAAYSAAHHPRSPASPARTGQATVAPGTPVPRQLPPGTAWMAGRAEELAWLDERLRDTRDRPAGSVEVVLIAGPPGVGKTTLAVTWAHSVAARFPDGQLYLDLHGHAPDAPPLSGGAALARALRSLGVPAPAIPVDPEEKVALYRSLLAERAVLILLDDAACAGHVEPLIPAGSRCLVLVTSRASLATLLPGGGPRLLTLDVLSPTDAVAVLARCVADPGASEETLSRLASRCAYLPLALQVAAAEVELRRCTVGEMLAALTPGAEDADHLEPAEDVMRATSAAFELSYRALPPEQRLAFRRLGLALTPDVTAELLEPLAGETGAAAARLLEQLARVHLLQRRGGGDFRMHDLLREFARARAAAEDGTEESEGRRRLLLDWYLQRAGEATEALIPYCARLPPVPGGPAFPPTRPAGEDARTWLERHRAALATAVHAAGADGCPKVAWRLADTLRGWFVATRHGTEWFATATDGLAAARAAGDPHALAAMLLTLGQAHFYTGRAAVAADLLGTAVETAAAAGWTAGESAALRALGLVRQSTGDLAESVALQDRSLLLDRATGNWQGEAATLNNLGGVRFDQGRLAEAARIYEQALDLHVAHGNDAGSAISSNNLAMVLLALGRLPKAARLVEQAIELGGRVGSREGEAFGHDTLARVHLAAGQAREALDRGEEATEAARAIGDIRVRTDATITVGRAQLRLGRTAAALSRLREALRDADEIGYARGRREALLVLAEAGQPPG